MLLWSGPAPVSAFDMVILDPGHGGIDEGTAWYHVREKDATLGVALRLQKILTHDGIPCVLTRDRDTYVSLDQRAEIANRHPHSLLLSIHFNGSSVASNDGFSTYYFSESPSGRFVAQTIQDALDESFSTRNRGTAPQNFAVLVRTVECAVLVECGFLSNRTEAAQFASADGQQWLAETLALGITRAKPVEITDPPECELAKCEAFAQRMAEKQQTVAAPVTLRNSAPPALVASKRLVKKSAAPMPVRLPSRSRK